MISKLMVVSGRQKSDQLWDNIGKTESNKSQISN
jgi:hypothetical protein